MIEDTKPLELILTTMSEFIDEISDKSKLSEKAIDIDYIKDSEWFPRVRRIFTYLPLNQSKWLVPIADGAQAFPGQSGGGKSTTILAYAIEIAAARAMWKEPVTVGETIEKDGMKSSLTAFGKKWLQANEDFGTPDFKKSFEKLEKDFGTIFDTIDFVVVNEPRARRMKVIDLLTHLIAKSNIKTEGTNKKEIIIIDSLNDFLAEYSRAYPNDPAQKGGWTFSQLELISMLNAYGEATGKVVLFALNTTFYGLESLIGRTEGEVTPDDRESINFRSRITGRNEISHKMAVSMWMAHTALSQGIQFAGTSRVLRSTTAFLPNDTMFEAE